MSVIFFETVNQVGVLFLIMLIGFIIKRIGIVKDDMDTCISQLELNVVLPALVFKTFSNNFRVSIISEKTVFFVTGLFIIVLSYIIAIFLGKMFSKDSYIRNIYIYSFSVTNFGYMGYSLVGGAFGEAQLFNMMIFCIPMNIFIYSLGTAMLNQKNSKVSLKGIINPVFFAMILGMIAGLANVPVPKVLASTCASLANCMGPLAMLVSGFVIAKFDIKELIRYKKVYLATLIRIVVMPGLFILAIKILGLGQDVMICTLASTAMSLGLNTVIFPATHGGDTKTGASMVLISNILGIITIPLMFALVL